MQLDLMDKVAIILNFILFPPALYFAGHLILRAASSVRPSDKAVARLLVLFIIAGWMLAIAGFFKLFLVEDLSIAMFSFLGAACLLAMAVACENELNKHLETRVDMHLLLNQFLLLGSLVFVSAGWYCARTDGGYPIPFYLLAVGLFLTALNIGIRSLYQRPPHIDIDD